MNKAPPTALMTNNVKFTNSEVQIIDKQSRVNKSGTLQIILFDDDKLQFVLYEDHSTAEAAPAVRTIDLYTNTSINKIKSVENEISLDIDTHKVVLPSFDIYMSLMSVIKPYVVSSKKRAPSFSHLPGSMFAPCPRFTPSLHVILVRHGHYINATCNDDDSAQVLSSMGKSQALITGKFLSEFCDTVLSSTPRDVANVELIHSDLTRARETASIVLSQLNATSTSTESSMLLREGWPGPPYCHSSSTNYDKQEEEEQKRMSDAFEKYVCVNESSTSSVVRIIVCHANVIRYFLCRALGVPCANVWGHFEINHTSITRIKSTQEDSGGNFINVVQSVNETSHLPETLKTTSEDHL